MPRPQRQNRKSKKSNGLDFIQFEDRKLLAANLSSGLQVPNDLPPATNLIDNGEFESFDQGAAPSVANDFATARFLPGEQVTGWNVIDGDGDSTSRINLRSLDSDRGAVLDLDSIPDQDDRVFQDVETEAGQQYLLAFDFRGSTLLDGTDGSTNDFEVYWNGELIASLTGGNFWQTAAYTVTGPSDGETTSRLEFRDMREGDRGGDGRGALIDCVRLTAVSDASIINGSFEDVGDGSGPDFSPDDVAGWSVLNFADDPAPRVIQINEFQPTDDVSDGENFLALNSDSDLIDNVFQDIATTSGDTYYVTFDYRVDPDSSAAPDQLRVRWNDAWAATFQGTSEWQSVGILLDADSDLTRLNFREAGGNPGDGAGPQIDNVQIFTINEVTNDLAIDLNGTDEGLATSQNFIAGSDPLPIAPNLTLSHQSGTQLTSAEVSLVGTVVDSVESLAFEADAVQAAGLTSEFDTDSGVLTLTGTAPIAQYQSVLQTVTYQNSADTFSETSRLISFVISDSSIAIGGTDSEATSTEINLLAQNNIPTLAAIEDQEVSFGEAFEIQTVADDIDGDTLTFETSVDGLNPGESQPTVSEEGEFSWVPTEAGEFDVTVTATDTSGAVVEQSFNVTVGSLTDVATADRNGIYPAAPGIEIDTDNTFDAIFDTEVGTIEVRLLADESPTFVNNFVSLARDGFYDGLVFHRVIDGFVAQGGDPLGTGTGGPGYQIDDEVGNTIPFDSRGQLSFANSGNDTTGSQFFITLDATNLNTGQFSVFGNVTAGDDVLDQIVRTQVGNTTPINGSVPTVINSITIVETPSNVS